jgi:hypothetical protein
MLKKLSFLLCILISSVALSLPMSVKAGPGDTIVVQAFTFGSPQDAWFVFPSDTTHFEKILMQYTLKCNPAQSPACGEWDYLTYTYLYKPTGLTDSSVVHQPLFLVNGSVKDTLSYSNTPTWNYTTAWQYFMVHNDTTLLNTFTSGTGSVISAQPFASSRPVSKTQYLWKASELLAAGMSAGNISGLQFYLQSLGSPLKNLCIRIKTTTLDSLADSTLEMTGFMEVYHCNASFGTTGWNSLQFLTPFNWDGTSNLLFEITYDNVLLGIDNTVLATDAGYPAGIFRSCSDRCVTFHNGAYISIPVNDSIAAMDSNVSVAFWAYGNPDYQPQDGTCFEALDASSNRVINAHVPWSNSNVYWDAGNAGATYDRINKAAATNEIMGQWNYWTFTKNALTGSMKIYLNGSLWHSGTGKINPLSAINKFILGKGNWSGSQSYEGRIDEFAVFGAELDQATIQDYMRKPVDALHPYYNKLFLYYHFDDGNYQTAADSASGNHDDATLISVDNSLKQATDYIYGFTPTNIRPNVIFEQGIYTSHLDSVLVPDSVINVPLQVITYTDSINNPGVPEDTFMVWPAAYYNYVYDVNGNLSDSIWVSPDSTLLLSYYDYYNYFPQVLRFELARYITPYGNGLSLGNGWTWTFDVSDYRTLLADSVHLAAGNWQELLDMKFLMIQGTPSRDVLSIQNLWNGGFNYGQSGDPIENHLTPLKILIPAGVQNARWKSRITGHGMDTPQNCAEFCPKYHYFKVDDSIRFTQLVWRDNCDLNPLYPQGGTWVYDRSNWCPGAEVWTYDFELSPYITPGDTVTLDHDAQPYTSTGGWDYYQIEDQLVTYGSPNFTLDAAIEKVLSPNTAQMWGRMNPICANPAIVIKNNGSTDLTSLTITYGINGATQSIYNWSGNLHFLETATVVLDTFTWMQGASKFTVSISNPNSGTDQYAYNNTISTPFTYVPVMPSTFFIELKSNNYPAENAYELKDDAGNLIFSRNGLTANTTYRDTLTLGNGCYEFRLTDSGEDGLTWWANTGQGSGSIRFRSATTSQVYKNFNSDFGGEVYMQFTVGLTSSVDDYVFVKHSELKIYPNPATDFVNIDFDLPSRQNVSVEITDIYGKTISSYSFDNKIAESIIVPVNTIESGLYFVTLRTRDDLITKKLVVQ